MTRSLIFVGLAVIAASANAGTDRPAKGVTSVNQPIVTRADYALDLNAPDGTLSPAEAARLDGWFRSMDLAYGDSVYVDGPLAYASRDGVAQVAARYGMLVALGAPMTSGAVPPGMARVVVTRTVATVPNCPNWSKAPTPNFDDSTSSNYGCGVNSNMAAMIANPQDLVHGREGSGVTDSFTSSRAVDSYRKATPSGASGAVQATGSKGN